MTDEQQAEWDHLYDLNNGSRDGMIDSAIEEVLQLRKRVAELEESLLSLRWVHTP